MCVCVCVEKLNTHSGSKVRTCCLVPPSEGLVKGENSGLMPRLELGLGQGLGRVCVCV